MHPSVSEAVRVRDKYISRACNECQRRKRKCSGESVCRNCRHWGTDCVFSHPRGLRHSRAANEPAPRILSADRDTASYETSSQANSRNELSRDESYENVAGRTKEIERTQKSAHHEPARATAQLHYDQQTPRQVQSPSSTTPGDNYG